MVKELQISAMVSRDTKELLEELVRTTGLKKGYVLEMALRHHLQALQELPADVIIPPRVIVSSKSGEDIAKSQSSTRKPAKELRKLMGRNGD